MSERKSYPLRINSAVIEAMQRWADDDLRSLNGQIEYVLRESLRAAGRPRRPCRWKDQGNADQLLPVEEALQRLTQETRAMARP
jgi:hypothetical protein